LEPIITSRSLGKVVGALPDSQASISNCLLKLSCANVLPASNSLRTQAFSSSHIMYVCALIFCKQGHFHRFHSRTTSSRRSRSPLHRKFSISESFLDLSLPHPFRSLCTKSWITFSRTHVAAGSAFLVTTSSHVLASIWASSNSCCNARERALRLSG